MLYGGVPVAKMEHLHLEFLELSVSCYGANQRRLSVRNGVCVLVWRYALLYGIYMPISQRYRLQKSRVSGQVKKTVN